jgi:hypothetical protein
MVIVKAKTITDIPMNLTMKNHCSEGSIGEITIIGFEDLAVGLGHSSSPDFELNPEAYSLEDDAVELFGGGGYADMMQQLDIPPPQIDHVAPHSVALVVSSWSSP